MWLILGCGHPRMYVCTYVRTLLIVKSLSRLITDKSNVIYIFSTFCFKESQVFLTSQTFKFSDHQNRLFSFSANERSSALRDEPMRERAGVLAPPPNGQGALPDRINIFDWALFLISFEESVTSVTSFHHTSSSYGTLVLENISDSYIVKRYYCLLP